MARRKSKTNAALKALAGVGAGLGVLAGAAAAWVAYSHRGVNHALPLPDALAARRFLFSGGRAGALNYYADTGVQGTPLVLIHSVNAGASAFEMKPLFEAFRGLRPVYALDLPGFGFSDRSDRAYTPQLYEDAVLDLVEQVIAQPVDVIALSLGSEFAARAALARPDLFRSLVLISPSGLGKDAPMEPGPAEPRESGAYRTLSAPLVGQPVYDLLATRASIRYFLNKSFVGPAPEEMVEYDYLTTHQPGAHYAPLHFVSGLLFTRGIRPAVYERLELPVLVIYDQDPFVGFGALPEVLESHDNWRAVKVTPTRGLAHWDQPVETTRVVLEFWASLAKPTETPPEELEPRIP